MDGKNAMVHIQVLLMPEIHDVQQHGKNRQRDEQDLGKGMKDILQKMLLEPARVIPVLFIKGYQPEHTGPLQPSIPQASRQGSLRRIIFFYVLIVPLV